MQLKCTMACAIISICAAVHTASAAELFMSITDQAVTLPYGWAEFCNRNLETCEPGTDRAIIVLTADRVRQLETTNREINRRYTGRNGTTDYPADGFANCWGYSLEKRRQLMAQGWPREALLLTSVIGPPSDPFSKDPTESSVSNHVVLTAHTDRGDFILDNWIHRFGVVLWSETRYRFKQRQGNATVAWTAIDDQRQLSWLVNAAPQ